MRNGLIISLTIILSACSESGMIQKDVQPETRAECEELTVGQLLDFLADHVLLVEGHYQLDVSAQEALSMGIPEAIYTRLLTDIEDMNQFFAEKMLHEGLDASLLPDPKQLRTDSISTDIKMQPIPTR